MIVRYNDQIRQQVSNRLDELLDDIVQAETALQTTLEQELRRVRYEFINRNTCHLLQQLDDTVHNTQSLPALFPMQLFLQDPCFSDSTRAAVNTWCQDMQDNIRQRVHSFDHTTLSSIPTGLPNIAQTDFDTITAAFHAFSRQMETIKTDWISWWAAQEDNALLAGFPAFISGTCIEPLCIRAQAICTMVDQYRQQFIDMLRQQDQANRGRSRTPAPDQTSTQPSSGTNGVNTSQTQPPNTPPTLSSPVGKELDLEQLRICAQQLLECQHLGYAFQLFLEFYSIVLQRSSLWLNKPISPASFNSPDMKNLINATRFALKRIAPDYIKGDNNRDLDQLWTGHQAEWRTILSGITNTAFLANSLSNTAIGTAAMDFSMTDEKDPAELAPVLKSTGAVIDSTSSSLDYGYTLYSAPRATDAGISNTPAAVLDTISPSTAPEEYDNYRKFIPLLDHSTLNNISVAKVLYIVSTFLCKDTHLAFNGDNRAVYQYPAVMERFHAFATLFLTGKCPPLTVPIVPVTSSNNRTDWSPMNQSMQSVPIALASHSLADYALRSYAAVERARGFVDAAAEYKLRYRQETNQALSLASPVLRLISMAADIVTPLATPENPLASATGLAVNSEKSAVTSANSLIKIKTSANSSKGNSPKQIKKLRKQMSNDPLHEELSAGADLKSCGIKLVEQLAANDPGHAAKVCAAFYGAYRYWTEQLSHTADVDTLLSSAAEQTSFIPEAAKAMAVLDHGSDAQYVPTFEELFRLQNGTTPPVPSATALDWASLTLCANSMLDCQHLGDMFCLFRTFYESLVRQCSELLNTGMDDACYQSDEMKNLCYATQFALRQIAQNYVRSDFTPSLKTLWNQKNPGQKRPMFLSALMFGLTLAESAQDIPDALESPMLPDKIHPGLSSAEDFSNDIVNAVNYGRGLKFSKKKRPALPTPEALVKSMSKKPGDFKDYNAFSSLVQYDTLDPTTAPKALYVAGVFLCRQTHLKREKENQAMDCYDYLIAQFQTFARCFLNAARPPLDAPDPNQANVITHDAFRNRFCWDSAKQYILPPTPAALQTLAQYVQQSYQAVERARAHSDNAAEYHDSSKADLASILSLGKNASSATFVVSGFSFSPILAYSALAITSTLKSSSKILKNNLFQKLILRNPVYPKAVNALRSEMSTQLQGNPILPELCSGLDLTTCPIVKVQLLALSNPAHAAKVCAAAFAAQRFLKDTRSINIDLRGGAASPPPACPSPADQAEFVAAVAQALSILDHRPAAEYVSLAEDLMLIQYDHFS